MKIALVQQHAGPARDENVARGVAALRRAAAAGAEVVAFAELAFERFWPQERATPERLALAEPIPGPTTELFQALAAELGVVLVLNLFERDGDRCYDTSPVIDADGTLLGLTRMVHITDYEFFHERGYYAPGDRGLPVYATAKGKIGVVICYDRHFPESFRALSRGGAEVVFVPQAGAVDEWPPGVYEAELQVAAFQNGLFTALCNRVGREERLEFAGESFVCDPRGAVIARAGRGNDEILHADLDLSQLEKSPARRLFLKHRRPELYRDWLSP
jgi:N-carbamoylputrescine amidase